MLYRLTISDEWYFIGTLDEMRDLYASYAAYCDPSILTIEKCA